MSTAEQRRSSWADAGTFPVAPGVVRVPLPLPHDGLRAVNVYILFGPSSVDIVDSGLHVGDAWGQLERSLREVGAELGDVRRVLVTHIHHDHYGQAALIRRASGALVFLGAGERQSLEAIIEVPGSPRARGRLMLAESGAVELLAELAGRPTDDSGDGTVWEYPDTWMTDGMRIQLSDRELRAIATPGHTAGHVSFVDDAGGLLFAGDHVLPHITPSIGLEVFSGRLPLGDFLDSLALVRDLPVSQVLPAHGEPFGDLARRVDELVVHHQVRLDAAAAAVASGAATVDAVARLLPWTRREVDFTSLDVFNRQLAIRETLAHLDLLVEHGRLRISHEDGVRLYAPLDATA